jgi:hypothetical protein
MLQDKKEKKLFTSKLMDLKKERISSAHISKISYLTA